MPRRCATSAEQRARRTTPPSSSRAADDEACPELRPARQHDAEHDREHDAARLAAHAGGRVRARRGEAEDERRDAAEQRAAASAAAGRRTNSSVRVADGDRKLRQHDEHHGDGERVGGEHRGRRRRARARSGGAAARARAAAPRAARASTAPTASAPARAARRGRTGGPLRAAVVSRRHSPSFVARRGLGHDVVRLHLMSRAATRASRRIGRVGDRARESVAASTSTESSRCRQSKCVEATRAGSTVTAFRRGRPDLLKAHRSPPHARRRGCDRARSSHPPMANPLSVSDVTAAADALDLSSSGSRRAARSHRAGAPHSSRARSSSSSTRCVESAVKQGATDIHVRAGDVVQARIDGALVPMDTPTLSPDDTRALADARARGQRHRPTASRT